MKHETLATALNVRDGSAAKATLSEPPREFALAERFRFSQALNAAADL
jgi:hypothetical protein